METSRDGVHLKQEKETCRQYSTEYGSIDTILDPPMFSINSIFKPYMQKKAIPMRKCYEMLKFEKFKFT
jgi:hypothetical protein